MDVRTHTVQDPRLGNSGLPLVWGEAPWVEPLSFLILCVSGARAGNDAPGPAGCALSALAPPSSWAVATARARFDRGRARLGVLHVSELSIPYGKQWARLLGCELLKDTLGSRQAMIMGFKALTLNQYIRTDRTPRDCKVRRGLASRFRDKVCKTFIGTKGSFWIPDC